MTKIKDNKIIRRGLSEKHKDIQMSLSAQLSASTERWHEGKYYNRSNEKNYRRGKNQ